MRLGEERTQLAMQLAAGVFIGAFVLAIFYMPDVHLPNPPIFGVPLGRIVFTALVALTLAMSLLMLFRAATRRRPVTVGQALSAVLPQACFFNIAGKSPLLTGMIVAAIAIDLFTAALVWLRDGQRGTTTP